MIEDAMAQSAYRAACVRLGLKIDDYGYPLP
jgi:hypothetical protein